MNKFILSPTELLFRCLCPARYRYFRNMEKNYLGLRDIRVLAELKGGPANGEGLTTDMGCSKINVPGFEKEMAVYERPDVLVIPFMYKGTD